MKSDDIPTLQQLVTAAIDWRNAALGVGVDISTIKAEIKNQPVTLTWDETNSTWDISTGN